MENIKEVEIVNPYGFIYITTNMINGKKYIGQKMFREDWQYYLGSGKLLKQAIKKYGSKNFNKEILAIVYSKEELDKLEIEFIKNHNAVESKGYYNISHGGSSPMAGLHMSDENKLKMSKVQKGKIKTDTTRQKLRELNIGENNPNYGKITSQDTKLKMSEANKGRKHSKESLIKMSEFQKGKTISIETKLKMSKAHKGKKLTDEQKKHIGEVQIKFNKSQVNEIREKYSTGKYTQRELAKEYLVGTTTINKVIKFKGVYNL